MFIRVPLKLPNKPAMENIQILEVLSNPSGTNRVRYDVVKVTPLPWRILRRG